MKVTVTLVKERTDNQPIKLLYSNGNGKCKTIEKSLENNGETEIPNTTSSTSDWIIPLAILAAVLS